MIKIINIPSQADIGAGGIARYEASHKNCCRKMCNVGFFLRSRQRKAA